MSPRVLLTACLALLTACGAAAPPAAPSGASAPKPDPKTVPGTIGRFANDPRVLVYTSNDWGFSTNTFFLEGRAGLVALDTQFLPSAAVEAIAEAQRLTGKKVVAAVVLHVNPDKFNGTQTFQAHGAKVVTSAQVAALIPAVHVQRKGKFWDTYAPDYPAEMPAPAVFGETDQDLEAGGLEVRLRVLGPGCSKAHVVAEWEGHTFGGDLVANGNHAWLELGLVDEWLARLDEMEATGPKYVHPGRGASGGAELLAQQRRYLEKVKALVKAEPVLELPMPDAALKRLRAAIEADYPGWGNAHFLRFGLPAIWRREAQARNPSPERPQ